MRSRLMCWLAALWVAAAWCVMAQAQEAGGADETVPIRRVILYKHGVGYFERIGEIEGDARVSLRFKAKDMSDLLKSLTVLDLGGGTIRNIAYDSTKTVEQQLAEYTFDLRQAQSLPAVLQQMKGSEVSMSVVGKPLAGRVLSVEKRLEGSPKEGQAESTILSILLPDATVKSYDLEDISDLRFTDPRLQKELQEYLAILFSRHRREEKEVVVFSDGEGARDLFLSYVQEQPIWKVSYRVVLAEEQKPLLQAWAIVDNVSGDDWENVELSLVSGLPVSFRQNLYDPYYVQRKVVQLMQEQAVGPVVHARGRELAERAEAKLRVGESGRRAGIAAEAMADAAAPGIRGYAAPRPDMLANMAQQAAQTVAQEAGALFVYHIDEPVTIRRDRSALLPIANARVEAKRIALYNENTRRDNPMDGMHLTNSTALTLEGGPITVIEEDTYVGESLIETLKPEEKRYVTFAVDLGTHVNPKWGSSSENVYMVKIIHGSMITYHKQRQTKTYALDNVEDKPKTIVIEHPIRNGWHLIAPEKPMEKTEELYRFEVKLDPKEKRDFTVTEERPGEHTYSLTNLSPDRIQFFLSRKYIDRRVEQHLRKIVALQSEINAMQREIARFNSERDGIFRDQTRLRENLKSLGNSEQERDYRGRIVGQLESQEDRIEKIENSVRALELQIKQKQDELNKLVKDLTFETEVD